MRSIPILIIALAILASCSAKDITEFDVAISKNQTKAMLECMSKRKPDLTGVSKEHMAFVLMSWENGERMMALMGKHPCMQGTNVYDAQIAEVQSKNKALSSGLGSLTDLGMWYIGGEVIKSALSGMNSYHVEGQFNDLGVENHVDSANTATRNDNSGNTTSVNDSPSDSNINEINQANPIQY